ncbi:MAG: futalosine hydrolase [Desulfovibrio sp.]|jgi:futalosine hydrolase|nr:futalosine hydrolase [Desulfovibrio sp.]
MPLLICAPTAEELAALLPGIAPEDAPEARLIPARLKQGPALACVVGVGPVNAALAMGEALVGARSAGTPVTAVLLAGLAGAFDLARLPLRSLCLVREEIWPEYGLHDGTSVTARAFSFPLWRRAAHDGGDVYDRLPLAAPEAVGFSPKSGVLAEVLSLTVAGVSASLARAGDLSRRYGADLENMEGFAVVYACARHGVPCMEIRAVSNKVGPRAREEKDFPGALRRLAQVLPVLESP